MANFCAQQEALIKDPDFDPSFNQLVDVTETTALDLTIEEAKTIARRGIYLPSSRWAVIAKDPDVFAMGRMMDVYMRCRRTGSKSEFSTIATKL